MTSIFKRVRAGLAGLALSLVAMAAAAPAFGYEVEPMRVVLDLEQGRTSAVLTIRNTRDAELPVEIVMKRRVVAQDGTQSFTPAEDDFSVFPPLAMIEPGASQAVRISYIGDPGLAVSEAFVAEVQEAPVTAEDFTGVVFAYNFGVAVYVRAPDARAELSVASAERVEGGIAFTVANAGTDYAMLGELGLRLDIAGDQVRFTPAQVGELVENPLIPPQARRVFFLPLANLPDGAPRVTLDSPA
ncbi:MAG: fimbria/pilus periplasmic chaperone [Oceanicaulis sp.]